MVFVDKSGDRSTSCGWSSWRTFIIQPSIVRVVQPYQGCINNCARQPKRRQSKLVEHWFWPNCGYIICQVPTYVPTEGAHTRWCLWSIATTNSSCHEVSICCIITVLSLDVLCHNHFIIQVLRKQLMAMLCYMFVGGQGLSVQRTLLHTCFSHIAIKLPQHGPTKYTTYFYTTFISIYVFEITPIIIKIIKKYFIAHYWISYANYEKIA